MEVPLQEPQLPLEPQEPYVPQVLPVPKDFFVEGDMTNGELWASLLNSTQFKFAQAHVFPNKFVTKLTKEVPLNLMLVLPLLEFRFSLELTLLLFMALWWMNIHTDS